MTYTLIEDYAGVKRDADGVLIPADTENFDWVEYQAWVAEGNFPRPPIPEPPQVPQVVTDKQFFQAAAQLGIISKLDALTFARVGTLPEALSRAVKLLPEDQQFPAEMAITMAKTFVRTDPFVVALSAAMGQTPEQVDQLFALAASL